jgi:hypothetical protein
VRNQTIVKNFLHLFCVSLSTTEPNPALKRDARKAARPLALR